MISNNTGNHYFKSVGHNLRNLYRRNVLIVNIQECITHKVQIKTIYASVISLHKNFTSLNQVFNYLSPSNRAAAMLLFYI